MRAPTPVGVAPPPNLPMVLSLMRRLVRAEQLADDQAGGEGRSPSFAPTPGAVSVTLCAPTPPYLR